MYADRYAKPGGIKPGSLAIAVGINATVIAMLALASPTVQQKLVGKPLKLVSVFETPPPEPIPQPKPPPRVAAKPVTPITVEVTKPITETIVARPVFIDPGPPPDLGALGGTGSGAATTVELRPIPPVFVGSRIDPRYASAFQPEYPSGERRMEREGVVHVKVLIGVDGQVKRVTRVDATSEAFFRATEQQALGKWRFQPATRDGIPVESWRTMSVTFVLKE